MPWGNAHGSIIYGPLRFETGIKTDESLVNGILVTCRFNSRESRRAVRLVPQSRIPFLSPFAMVKQAIDGIFLQNNNKDPLSESLINSFVASALKYQYAKSIQRPRLRPAELDQVRIESVQKTTDLIRYQGNSAYGSLVEARVRSFVSLMITKPGLANWNTIFQNCQHFCSAVLESECFVRRVGYDNCFEPNSLPSIRKVFRLDQKTEISPWFSEYFSTVERLKGRTTMLSFRTADVGEQPRTSLLDLRKFGIPALPNRIDHTQTNDRLGVQAGESADAWFALSAISLFFVVPHDALLEELAGKVATVSVENAMGMLALGYFKWLEKVAQYHLLDEISLRCYASLKPRELEAISKPETFRYLLDEIDALIEYARAKKDRAHFPWKKRQLDKELKKLERKKGELGAIWDLEVDIPKARAEKRGKWDWFKTLG
ncbi:hypothetical protein H0H81_000318 [Sphagnurus paluster]|uniref:Uncharacterized protein n=1 Tax=Sphagnurus paluster TaxID=117069 RepID=A0A9P7KHV5_9AGAR|nr:hypothetical protein H0H81_000318 [Sphagnurus paluster]